VDRLLSSVVVLVVVFAHALLSLSLDGPELGLQKAAIGRRSRWHVVAHLVLIVHSICQGKLP
jgi:hypothetical protein